MKLGIIGTGLMGSNIAKCLSRKGYKLVLYNRTKWKAERLAEELGCSIAETPGELFKETNISIAFISGDEALYDIIYSDKGVINTSTRGVLINASTVTPMASTRVYRDLKKRGIGYIEAPVYGSTSEAKECRLLSIVAGERYVYNSVEAIIKEYSRKVHYVGEIPSATVIKLALNNIGLALPALLAESLALLEAWNINIEVYRNIAGELWFGEAIGRYWKRIIEEKPPRFKVWMAGKDYWYIASALKAKKIPSNISETLSSAYMQAAVNGYSDEDYPQIARYYMELVRRGLGRRK